MKSDKEIIRIMHSRISALERLCCVYRTNSRMTETLMNLLEKTSKAYAGVREQIGKIIEEVKP